MDLAEKTANKKRHPWELSRAHQLLQCLEQVGEGSILADIGAGDQFFAAKLHTLNAKQIFAIDNMYSSEKSIESGITSMPDISLLENKSIDCLIMMDVLEHVEDDSKFLIEILKKVKKGAKIVITVPAHQFLFSDHDIFLKHYRRYQRNELLATLKRNGISVEKCHYFYTSLFIIRCIMALKKRIFPFKNETAGVGSWSYKKSHFITRTIFAMLNLDFFVNGILDKVKIRPFGLSLLAVCRKD